MSLSENPNPVNPEEVDSFAGWLLTNSERLKSQASPENPGAPLYAGVISREDSWNALLVGEKLHLWSKKGSEMTYNTVTRDLNFREINGDIFNEVVGAFKLRYER